MASSKIIRRLLHFWFLIRRPMTLGVRVLVQDETGAVLLVRHTYVRGWYFPGGGVEPGDTMQKTARKEVYEETGIELNGDLELMGVFHNLTASKRDHVTFYRCHQWDRKQEFSPNREIAEIGFFKLDDLPDGITPSTWRRLQEVYFDEEMSDHW